FVGGNAVGHGAFLAKSANQAAVRVLIGPPRARLGEDPIAATAKGDLVAQVGRVLPGVAEDLPGQGFSAEAALRGFGLRWGGFLSQQRKQALQHRWHAIPYDSARQEERGLGPAAGTIADLNLAMVQGGHFPHETKSKAGAFLAGVGTREGVEFFE